MNSGNTSKRFLTFFLAGTMACCFSAMAQAGSVTSERLMENVSPGVTLLSRAATDSALKTLLSELAAEAGLKGSVDVVVKMAVPFAPETLLGLRERLKQRREIAVAAKHLQKEFPHSSFSGQGDYVAYADMPYVKLRVSSAELEIVGKSPDLISIVPAKSFNWRRDFVQLRAAPKAGGTAGSRGATVTPKIVGGTDAAASTHPFQVGLMYKNAVRDDFNDQFCGGTLVAQKYVVTAAHCSDFIGNAAAEVQVLAGTQRLDQSGRRINISRVNVHPSWNTRTMDYDVSVWELSEAVTDIAFASLASAQPTVAGTSLRVTGWGSLAYQGYYPINLQQVDVPYVATSGGYCQYQGGITSRMICAGTAGKDSCQGDSGGPLTLDGGSGYTVLAGIVSYGNGCALANYPGVYTNVANSGISNYIQGIVNGTPAPAKMIEFQSAAKSVGEGGRTVTLTLVRSSSTGAASVRYATGNGTATAGLDYRSASGTVNFKSGRSTATVSISITNDRIREGSEDFTVSLSSPSTGYGIGGNAATTVTILDND